MFTRLFIAAIFLRRCATGSSTVSKKHFQSGESVIPAGEEAARLAFPPKPHQSIEVHSTYRKNLPQTIRDEEGRDFAVDYEPGEIRRTAPSRIPDFRTNVLFGVEDFDHGKFPGFSNNKFFVFVDYAIKRKSIGSSNRRKSSKSDVMEKINFPLCSAEDIENTGFYSDETILQSYGLECQISLEPV